MITFDSYSFSYGKKRVLSGVDLVARDGEITVVLGHNGCGKTTLINSVFLTRGGTSVGNITVDGRDVAKIGRRELSRLVALMPQSAPSPEITVRELVSLGRSPHLGAFGRLSPSDRELVENAIMSVGLSHLADSFVSQISGGERQAAYFAMLIAKDAGNILLDEPISSLDPINKEMILSFVKAERSRGRCILLVMHDLTEACRIADRIYVIDGGVASFPFAPEEFAASDLPERVFGVRAHTVLTEGGERQVFLPI